MCRTWNRQRGSSELESWTICKMRGRRVPISTSRTLKRNPRSASSKELLPSDWPPSATISGIGSFSPNATAAACRRLKASNLRLFESITWCCCCLCFLEADFSPDGVLEGVVGKLPPPFVAIGTEIEMVMGAWRRERKRKFKIWICAPPPASPHTFVFFISSGPQCNFLVIRSPYIFYFYFNKSLFNQLVKSPFFLIIL